MHALRAEAYLPDALFAGVCSMCDCRVPVTADVTDEYVVRPPDLFPGAPAGRHCTTCLSEWLLASQALRTSGANAPSLDAVRALVLFSQGLTFDDIGQVFGLHPETVMSRIGRVYDAFEPVALLPTVRRLGELQPLAMPTA
jgi:hypothetical protein